MARHTVAANLVMVFFILGGLLMSTQVKQEVFPQFKANIINVEMDYPGASPEEVEQGIVLAIEDAVRGVNGVKRVTSVSREGQALVIVTFLEAANAGTVLQDVTNVVQSIVSFPELAEKPIIRLVEVRDDVLDLMVYGDLDEYILRDTAERLRDEIMQLPDVTLVEIDSARSREISIEVPQRHLRAYGLTLEQIAKAIGEAAIELPGGGIKTSSGEVLLRTQGRRDFGREYAEIPVLSTSDGTTLRIGDIATITDGFVETDEESFYNGQRAVRVEVFAVGQQSPQSVSGSVKQYLEQFRLGLPDGIGVAIWLDDSEEYRDRMQLLLKNAFLGLALVLLVLGLFLDLKLAFWVTIGLITAIMGSFWFIPLFGASINMISLFAFIVTLGIIVDDGVVAGEIIWQKREQGLPFLDAAIAGAQEIAGPITFAVLTNIAAFLPLFFIPGVMGNFMMQVPAVVVAVFVISLIEALFILPAHLAGPPGASRIWGVLDRPRNWFSHTLQTFIHTRYQVFLRWALAHRYVTVAIGLALLILTAGFVQGGHIPITFMPAIDSEYVMVQATLPYGTPIDRSRKVLDRLQHAAAAAIEKNGGEAVLQNVFSEIGYGLFTPHDEDKPPALAGGHLVGMEVALVPANQRDFSGVDFENDWRTNIGTIPGVESLAFKSDTGPSGGAPIDIQLTHRSRTVLEAAAKELAKGLSRYQGVMDIDDGVARGKPQISFRIKPEAQNLGLNEKKLAQQVRSAFFGVEALRQQRGRDEVKVMVRLPENERHLLYTVEQLVLRTEQGGEIMLGEAADLESGWAYTEIQRQDGRRIISVTAAVDEQVANANTVIGEVLDNELVFLMNTYPGLTYSLKGEQASQQESISAMAVGFSLALLMIYGLLALPFRSYVQPLIVMLCIPFGMIGGIVGHVLLGYGLSLISFLGMIALAGVVVNDSLVLIVATNQIRQEKHFSATEAVVHGSLNRFRPILLTSLTTFFGLAPMIFETAFQARFIIPMAISLGFGILFGTVFVLTLVPACYLIVEDLCRRSTTEDRTPAYSE